DDRDIFRFGVCRSRPLAVAGNGHAAGTLSGSLNRLGDGVRLAVNDGHGSFDSIVTVAVNPDFAIGSKVDTDRSAGNVNDLFDRVGFAVDHDHAVIVTMRVVDFVRPRLNLEIVPAFQQQVDLLQYFVALRVVDDHTGDVRILNADIKLAAVRVKPHAVR